MKQLLTLALLLLCAAPMIAQDIDFARDLFPDDALLGANGGYRLYSSKQSGSYSEPPVLTVPPGTTAGSIARPRLGRYYFVATAFDSEENESAYSNEVTTVIKPRPPRLNPWCRQRLPLPLKPSINSPLYSAGKSNSGL